MVEAIFSHFVDNNSVVAVCIVSKGRQGRFICR